MRDDAEASRGDPGAPCALTRVRRSHPAAGKLMPAAVIVTRPAHQLRQDGGADRRRSPLRPFRFRYWPAARRSTARAPVSVPSMP